MISIRSDVIINGFDVRMTGADIELEKHDRVRLLAHQ